MRVRPGVPNLTECFDHECGHLVNSLSGEELNAALAIRVGAPGRGETEKLLFFVVDSHFPRLLTPCG